MREARAIGSYEKLSPLLITALQYLNHPLFWVSLDAAAAYTLMGISKRCARFYIYNPLIILTTLAQSCVSVQNALILSALSMAYQKRALAALCLLSLASVLFMYPAALLPPLIMVLLGDTSWTAATVIRLVSVFVTSTISAVSLCRYIAADWSFVNLYKSLILVDDLTPNTGLFWYLLVEMFEQFKPFFTMVLQIHTVIYVPSVCIFLRCVAVAALDLTNTIQPQTDARIRFLGGHACRFQVVSMYGGCWGASNAAAPLL